MRFCPRNDRGESRSYCSLIFFGRAGGLTMRKTIFGLIMLFLAASVSSAASLFSASGETEADFCFGYAICE
jgi:hypothetical protein